MPDRLIRDELLESERWLFLPTDTDRLVFVGLIFRADDFGNLEGGSKRLFRFMQAFAQVKSEENSATVLMHLADADLVRRYEVEAREFFHVPRFRPHRKYLVRKCPPSPWCDRSATLGKVNRVLNRGLANNLHDTSHASAVHVLQGVGVGVGVGENLNRSTDLAPVDKSSESASPWVNHWKAKGKALGMEARPGESERQYCDRVRERCAHEKSN